MSNRPLLPAMNGGLIMKEILQVQRNSALSRDL